MSNNIWGYQGLQTPLENLTNGQYSVADYTQMRREFGARITALENTGGFIPTNVSINGYCNVVPGTGGYGNFSVTGTSVLGGTLSVAQNATFNSNVTITGTLNAGTITFANISTGNVNATGSVTAAGNISTTAGKYIGNGCSLGLVGEINVNQTLNQVITPPANIAKQFNIILNYTANCTVQLTNLYPTLTDFPDSARYITIVKKGLASGAYSVTLSLPVQAGYTWYWATPTADFTTGTISMGASVFSYTFLVRTNGVNTGACYLVAQV